MITDSILRFLREKAYPAYNVEYAFNIPRMTRRLVGSVLDSLDERDLEELLDRLCQDQDAPYYLRDEVRWHISRPPREKAVQRNEPITRLIAWYTDKKSKKVSSSAAKLKRRFSGQSFSVQKAILKTFLQGGRKETEWAGRYLRDNWIPSFRDIIVDRWKETRLPIFAHVILRHLPDGVVFQNQEWLSKDAGYASVCARIGNMDGFLLDESRLTPSEWFYVMAKLGREDAIPRMDEQLKACILALTPRDMYLLREDSLLSVQPLGLAVWAMKKLNCAGHILRLSSLWDRALAFASREEDDYDRSFALVFSLQRQAMGLPEDEKAYEDAKKANTQALDYQQNITDDLADVDTDIAF